MCILENAAYKISGRRHVLLTHLPMKVGKICVLQRLVNGDAMLRMENQLVQSKEEGMFVKHERLSSLPHGEVHACDQGLCD